MGTGTETRSGMKNGTGIGMKNGMGTETGMGTVMMQEWLSLCNLELASLT